jgi:hypothetical protein
MLKINLIDEVIKHESKDILLARIWHRDRAFPL